MKNQNSICLHMGSRCPLLERAVNSKTDEAYSKLKAALVGQGCKLTGEEIPNQACFRQGSLWGVAPQSAKKTITVNFEPEGEGTRIRCSSKLSSDWKNITLVGCGLAAVLVGLCVWMATDLGTTALSNLPGYWGWLVTVNGNVDLVAAQTLVRLTWGLAGFLSLVIALEVAIVVYVNAKIDAFTEEALEKMS
jgi:hypothetical protein